MRLLNYLSLVLTTVLMAIFLYKLGEFAFHAIALLYGLLYMGPPLLFCLICCIQRCLFLRRRKASACLGILCCSLIAVVLVEVVTMNFFSLLESLQMDNWPLVRLLVYVIAVLDLFTGLIAVVKKLNT